MFDVAWKGSRICGTLQQHGWSHTCSRHGSNQRGVLLGIARNGTGGAFTPWRTGVDGCQVDVASAFVHDDEIVGGTNRYSFSICCSGLLVALGGSQRLFLRVQPKR